jgi:peptide/nickel transport system substrate-binding protein
VRAHTGKALVAGIAAAVLALGACSSSGGGGGGTTGVNTQPPNTSSGAPSSSGGVTQTSGTFGTGNFADCGTDPLHCNSGSGQQGGQVIYTVEKTVVGWNINYTPSNVFDVAEMLDSLVPGAFIGTPDLKPSLNTDMMVSAEQTKTSPQTLTYKIQPNAVWSDGTPITADDFIYQAYTSDGTHCPKCAPSTTAGYSQIKSITGSDNGKTVTVVMKSPFAEWQSMFGTLYPAHIAKQHGDDGSPAGLKASFLWFDKNVPTWSGGPFMISKYTKNTSIVETPNAKWYGKTKPSLDKIIFNIITDQAQEVPALQNKDVDVMYSQPNQDMVNQAKAIPNVNIYLGKGLVWEHLSFNEKNQFLKDKALRTAIFTAVNRKDIIARTVGTFVPGIQPLGNHIYVPGQPGYQDNVTSTGQGSGDIAKAKQILTQAGYTGVGSTLKTKDGKTVAIRCTYSLGNTNRQETCQLVQAALKQLGIAVTLKTTPDLGELGTGNYDLIVFAWVGAPFPIAGAQQIYEVKGGADYGHNVDPAAEKLINQAQASTDPAKVLQLMNQADKDIQADAYELPLYQKPTFMAAYNNIVNLRDNATSTGPPYNTQEWAVTSQ